MVLYRWRLGWLLGHRFLLLIHVGRRSGVRHETVVEVVHYDDATHEAIVLSGWGTSADWYRNVLASTSSEIIIGRQRWVAEHRVLDEREAVAVFAEYEHRNRMVKPVVNRVLTSLLGWRYDSTEEARQRLVAQLPMVAFRPAVE